MKVRNRNHLFIVVISISSDKLENLKTFFSFLKERSNLTFVLITPLNSDHLSHIAALLQPFSFLKVVPMNPNQEFKKNHIYVLPQEKIASINQGILKRIEPRATENLKMPIDFFLRSFAIEHKERGIFIVLSGTHNDGTIGLRMLRERGGLIIVQNEAAARYTGMSKSVINTGLVDYILLPEKIGPFISDYAAHFYDKNIQIANSIADEIAQILHLVNTHTGRDFSLYKQNTIFRRIQKRLNLLQMDTLSAYIKYLRKTPSEIKILLGELLINVTNFFRDPEAFEVLKKEIIKRLAHNKINGGDLRVWVPGCSTGEEAYSIAILLQECMEAVNHRFNIQIFGTDIDDDAIEAARKGIFSSAIKDAISPERLNRFFIKEGNSYKVKGNIRKMIIFAKQNLVKDPPFTRLDILSCRNLLIYLNSQLQKKILSLFQYSLKPDALLLLGPSETVGEATNLFTIIDRKWKVFEKKYKTNAVQRVLNLPSLAPFTKVSGIKMEENMHHNKQNLLQTVEQFLLKKHMPASIVIDEKATIIYVYGKTSRFIEFAPGEIKLHLLTMIRKELRSKLSLAIKNAIQHQKEINFKNLQFKENEEIKCINITVSPILEAESFKEKLLLIIFEEVNTLNNNKEYPEKLNSKDKLEKKIIQLDQELRYSKENLYSTIEELKISNEELKSSNEELQSRNEELQSINEEIETSKEEFQSLNEELTTVNAELESRIEQLSSANEDIKNLLDSIEVATIFLDKNLCIKYFSQKVTEIINLISSDVGRPISHIVSNLHYEKLIDDARNVLHTFDAKITEVIDKNNHWYAVRIIPYKTVNNIIDGVVITFWSINAQKKAEHSLVALEQNVPITSLLLNKFEDPAILITQDKKLLCANQKFLTKFKLKMDNIRDKYISDFDAAWEQEKLNELIDKIINSPASTLEYKIKGNSNIKNSIVAYKTPPSILICFN